jgi:hypothetical protein
MKKVTAFLQKMMHALAVDLGIANSYALQYLPVIISFFGKLIALQGNVTVQAIEDLIIGHNLESMVTQIMETVFGKFVLGSKIEADYAAAPTLAAKIHVVLTDLWNGDSDFAKSKIGSIAAMIIKLLGGDAMSLNTASRLVEDQVAVEHEAANTSTEEVATPVFNNAVAEVNKEVNPVSAAEAQPEEQSAQNQEENIPTTNGPGADPDKYKA